MNKPIVSGFDESRLLLSRSLRVERERHTRCFLITGASTASAETDTALKSSQLTDVAYFTPRFAMAIADWTFGRSYNSLGASIDTL